MSIFKIVFMDVFNLNYWFWDTFHFFHQSFWPLGHEYGLINVGYPWIKATSFSWSGIYCPTLATMTIKLKIKWKHRSKLKTHFPTAWGGEEFNTLFIISVFYFIFHWYVMISTWTHPIMRKLLLFTPDCSFFCRYL